MTERTEEALAWSLSVLILVGVVVFEWWWLARNCAATPDCL